MTRLTTSTEAKSYALCFCTDGQHAEPDRESLRPDRESVEHGVMYVRPADALPDVHLVEAVTTIHTAPFADEAMARYRDDVVAMWQGRHTNQQTNQKGAA